VRLLDKELAHTVGAFHKNYRVRPDKYYKKAVLSQGNIAMPQLFFSV